MMQQYKKIEQFWMDSILAFEDEVSLDELALRALGELICSSDLELFSGGVTEHCADLRFGLKKLIDLCIDHQKNKLDSFFDKARNSAEFIIREAMHIKKNQGDDSIRKVLAEVDLVLSQYGPEEYPQAVTVRARLLALLDGKTACVTKEQRKAAVCC